MNNNTKILIGVGITATAAYFIFKKPKYQNANAKPYVRSITKPKRDAFDWILDTSNQVADQLIKDTPLQRAKKWLSSFF
jgi:hypothetical protein